MNAKNKGNSFERLICKQLSLALTNGETAKACWRSENSGGSATRFVKKNSEEKFIARNSGDICSISEKGDWPNVDWFFSRFMVECKAYKQIGFYPPLKDPLAGFLDQCLLQGASSQKKPLLICKQNNKSILCIHPTQDTRELQNKKFYFILNHKDIYFVVCDFTNWLTDIVELATEKNKQ